MNILKIILIAIVLVLAAFGGLMIFGMALSLLRLLFWVAVICVVVALLAKLFGGSGGREETAEAEQLQPQNVELTLEEYKRKLEAQMRQDSDAGRG
jgi:hypothetical protein